MNRQKTHSLTAAHAILAVVLVACTSSRGSETATASSPAKPASQERDVQVYLLFGQSNMWGVPASEERDHVINPKVEVMALTKCDGQTPDEWYPASPPLHGCIGKGEGNPGLGPGDYFAKTIASAHPDDTILLVPNAIPGVSIDAFAPGKAPYQSLVTRARKAQERGPIRGLIFHQGESDTGQRTWVSRANTLVSSLRRELELGDAVPFVAGELPYDGCCGAGHNPIIRTLPEHVPNTHVVSAEGLGIMDDGLHFDADANRELGRRYAEVMLPLLAK